jgi:FAD/FMN-containing dehydrogenase
MKIEEIFPPTDFSFNELDCLVYSRDASSLQGTCKGVVWPRRVEQLKQLFIFARKTGIRFSIRGAGTSTYGGCIPAGAIVIDMSKMNKIVEVGRDFVTVEAGMVLDELNKKLGNSKMFPISPIEHAVCTIGGMVATNTVGMQSVYGKMEKWVEAIDVVDGSGKSSHITGPLLKDFLGKEGVTGIIYQVKLRTVPSYVVRSVSLFQFQTLSAMMEKVNELESNLSIVGMDYFDEKLSQMLGLGSSFHVLVTFKDMSGEVTEDKEVREAESFIEKIHHSLIKRRLEHKEDVLLPLEHVARFLHWLRKQNIACYGSFKSGIFYTYFRNETVAKDMYRVVESLSGTLAAVEPKGLVRKKFISEIQRKALSRLKKKYDSQKFLNRGVLVD